jgi:hypothetical protein
MSQLSSNISIYSIYKIAGKLALLKFAMRGTFLSMFCHAGRCHFNQNLYRRGEEGTFIIMRVSAILTSTYMDAGKLARG